LRIILLALVLALIPKSVSAGTRDPNTPDSKYLEYGKKFHSVLRIRAVNKDNEKQYASAVAIRPHWVLTAAHVVENTTDQVILRNDDKEKLPLNKVIIHSDFDHKTLFGFNDIALAYSPQDFALDFYPELYTDTDEAGKVATLAGFGLHGDFHTGHTLGDTQRRAGSNVIESFDRAMLVCTPSKENKTALEFLIAPGDSGGGLFIGNKLAGVHSMVMAIKRSPNSVYGDESGHTRVSLYANWVESEIEKYELALKARATTGPAGSPVDPSAE
jgi:hypothetical protein